MIFRLNVLGLIVHVVGEAGLQDLPGRVVVEVLEGIEVVVGVGIVVLFGAAREAVVFVAGDHGFTPVVAAGGIHPDEDQPVPRIVRGRVKSEGWGRGERVSRGRRGRDCPYIKTHREA